MNILDDLIGDLNGILRVGQGELERIREAKENADSPESREFFEVAEAECEATIEMFGELAKEFGIGEDDNA